MEKPLITAKYQIVKLIQLLGMTNKNISTEELVCILENTKSIYYNHAILDAMIFSLKSLSHNKLYKKECLTQREQDVMLMIGNSQSNVQISEALKLSVSTVETHRKNIRKKIGIKGNSNFMVFAIVYRLQHQHLTESTKYFS
ncbi:MAG: hypothetical protein Wins2KO_29740 [Winogradskyella sp.]